MKLERLRAAVDVGIDQLARGEGIDYDRQGLQELGARIKAEGRLPSRSRSVAPAFAKPASAGERRSAKQGKKTGA
ncbi:MAG: hypothetical protein WD014_00765 [Dongiaceae bacterium]